MCLVDLVPGTIFNLNLVPTLRRVTEGDIAQVPQTDRRAMMATQRLIRSNLAAGRETTDEEIIAVAKESYPDA